MKVKEIESKSFTLIELMLVIGIIAVFAGSMIPMITSARQEARAAAKLLDFDLYRNACIDYRADTGVFATEVSESFVWYDLSNPWVPKPGWDGPYIPRSVTREEDAAPGTRFYIWPFMMGDFDLDGDGAVDKNNATPGQSIGIFSYTESDANAMDRLVDKNIPGDWMATGKVRFYPSTNRLTFYLLGGS